MKQKVSLLFYILSGIAGIIVFLVLGVLIGNYIVMPLVTRQYAETEVPSVIGLYFEEAKEKLKDKGLGAVCHEEIPDPEKPKGVVISQKPKPGAIVKKGRIVFLTVSKGRERIRVPYLLGLRLEQAMKIAESRGFRVARVDSVMTDTIEEGRVIAMKPTPEIYVLPKTPIILTVSTMDTSATMVMPVLEGVDFEKAKEILRDDSLVLGSVREIEVEGQGGIVIIQTPKPGAKIKKGDTVHLIVGKER